MAWDGLAFVGADGIAAPKPAKMLVLFEFT
jgi:hypothetical protein